MTKITTEISKPIDNNYVQVDVSSPKMSTRSYKVPKDKADSFCNEYKNMSKKNETSSTLTYTPITLGCALFGAVIARLTKLNIALSAIVAALGALCGDMISMKIIINNTDKKEHILLNNFNASEIKQEKISDIIKG